ncbi:vacuolar protein sorting-associated protein 11 homolog isoform X2 [Ornithodoros turicata]
MQHHALLVTIGADETGINPLIKVWSQEKADKHGKPICTRITRAVAGIMPSPVKSLAVHENLILMAVGFEDGNILLFRGDITRDRQSKHIVLSTGTVSVNVLAFKSSGKQHYLFGATTEKVISINTTIKGKEEQHVLDLGGCGSRCAVMSDMKQDHQFVVGRQDAVYFYQPEGRGPCFAFEEEKVLLHWFRNYLVVVGKDTKHPLSSGQAPEKTIVSVYDIQNKFVAYSAPTPGVVDVFSEWGLLFILVQDGKLYCLQEKDTQSKLELLFKKNQYAMAISLAKSQQYDEDGLVDIFRQYGDHLSSKGDHEAAVQQYIMTIGKLEASYVIRKFLDAQRIHNLTEYLQALHKKGLATEDHTTLLLNCYTKLQDDEKLSHFVMAKDTYFDVEIAIKVCRQAGYYDQALYLAEKHNCHDLYLRIKLENCHDYLTAINYIARLPFTQAESYMKKYGKTLLTYVPEQTTDLLKNLCYDYRPSNDPLPVEQRSHPEDFIHIFVSNSEKLLEFLQHMVEVQPQSSTLVYNTLLELHLQSFNHQENEMEKKVKGQQIMDMLKNSEGKYDLDQAMVLCQMNHFKTGILHLYEKARLYQQILSYHIDNCDYEEVIRICERFGGNDPNLWIQALCFFSTGNQKDYFSKVLTQIEKQRLLPPIMVVDIAARSHKATLATVKDYLVRHLMNENRQMEENKRLIVQYRKETERIRNHIEELKNKPKVFQVSKCCGCNHLLELPSVHFLCGHSYHQHCFENYSESDDCPHCLPENSKVLDIIRSQEQAKDLHEQFHHQLERSDDGFSVVADYFGKGLFNKVTLLTDPPRCK